MKLYSDEAESKKKIVWKSLFIEKRFVYKFEIKFALSEVWRNILETVDSDMLRTNL